MLGPARWPTPIQKLGHLLGDPRFFRLLALTVVTTLTWKRNIFKSHQRKIQGIAR
jgi:hypothetical protein